MGEADGIGVQKPEITKVWASGASLSVSNRAHANACVCKARGRQETTMHKGRLPHTRAHTLSSTALFPQQCVVLPFRHCFHYGLSSLNSPLVIRPIGARTRLAPPGPNSIAKLRSLNSKLDEQGQKIWAASSRSQAGKKRKVRDTRGGIE